MSEIPDTPWGRATNARKGRRHEQRLAKHPGGKLQPGSGRIPGIPRDVRLNGFLLEARVTDKGSYSVNAKEFGKIEREALGIRALPGMALDIQGRRLVVVREEDHLDREKRLTNMQNEIKELKRRIQDA